MMAKDEQAKTPRLLKDRFFWYIVALAVLLGVNIYLVDITEVGWLPSHEEWELTYLVLQRLLFLGAVALAAWRFGVRGGLATCFALGSLLALHAIETLMRVEDALLEVGAVVTFGIIASWLIDAYMKGRRLLGQSEENFRNSIDSSPVGISIVTREGKLIYTNQSLLDIYGYGSAEELRAVPLKRRYTPQSYAEHRVRQENMRQGKAVPASYGLSIIGKDGEVKHLSVSWDEVYWDGEPRFQVIYQDITERRRSEKILRNIAEGVSAKTGGAFFQSLVKHLAETLGVDFAIIGELVGGKEEMVRTIAVYAHGVIVDNFEYSLAGTPCENVVGKSLCAYPSGVQQQFPQDHLLVEMGVEGYIGTPLFASAGGALGLIAVMDGKPIGNTGTVMLRIFAARAAAELERMRAEEMVIESEERYRTLVNLGGKIKEAVIMEQDTEQGEAIQIFVSDSWSHITGYPKEELLSMSFFDLVHPQYRQAAIERHRGRMKGKTISELPDEKSIIRKDGTEVPIESVVATATYRGKRVHIAYIRDITERKKAEEALRKSEEHLRSIFESANDAIVSADSRGHIISWNKMAETMFGYSVAEILGKPLTVIMPERFRQAHKNGIRRVVSTGRTSIIGKTVEVGGLRKDGSEFPIELSIATWKMGDEVFFTSNLRDITESKQAEEREKRLQKELNLSSRLAAIGQLAAGVAHEINNPLTGIIGFSQLLMGKSTDKEVKGDLERIYNEGLRAAKVVQNLLAFARRRELKKEYSDINDILQKALELAYGLKTGNIKVVTNLASGLPRTMVDFGQIQQVFLNIVINAGQAMVEADRGGKLTIKTQKMKDCIRVSFTDDGPGIPADKLGRLFEPFFTTRENRGGTGLGLSVCHGIVTEHGGKIYARSKPGKGTIFFVELPLTSEIERSPET